LVGSDWFLETIVLFSFGAKKSDEEHASLADGSYRIPLFKQKLQEKNTFGKCTTRKRFSLLKNTVENLMKSNETLLKEVDCSTINWSHSTLLKAEVDCGGTMCSVHCCRNTQLLRDHYSYLLVTCNNPACHSLITHRTQWF
jgi:hypothetical protein